MKRQTSKKKKNVKKLGPQTGKNQQADIPAWIEGPDRPQPRTGICDVPVPEEMVLEECSAREAWTEIERESFLLGLYLFGKDLEHVKRLVGTEKKMGDLMRFYYGKFYASREYRKWAKFRKKSNGEKIFSGWRHEKFSTRLFSLSSDDFQDKLFEASVNFANKSLGFEEYVFMLRDTVGVETLVAAVGIGRGGRDLTEAPQRRPRDEEPSEPLDKDHDPYASLEPSQIVEALRAEPEPSKGFFWRTVWPRLVSRGWRSERVKDITVFIVDGAKKFSRRLVKGREYFESVQDVVARVASQPRILGHRERRFRLEDPSNKVNAAAAKDTSRFPRNETLVEVRNLPSESNVGSPVKSGDETLIKLRNLPRRRTVASLVKSGDETLIELPKLPSGRTVASPVKSGDITLIELRKFPSGSTVASPVKSGYETLIELQKSQAPPSGSAGASPIMINNGEKTLIELKKSPHPPSGSAVDSPVEINDGDKTLTEPRNSVASPMEINGADKSPAAEDGSQPVTSQATGDETLTELPKPPSLPMSAAEASPVKINGADDDTAVINDEKEKFSLGFDLNVEYVLSDSEEKGDRDLMIDLNVEYVPTDCEAAEQTAKGLMVGDCNENKGPRKSKRKRQITKRAIEALEIELVDSKKRKHLSGF